MRALNSGGTASGPPSVSAFRNYQQGVATTLSTTDRPVDPSAITLKPGTHQDFLPVLRDAPKGLEVCANAVVKFADYYASLAGLKLGTLAGFKEDLARRGCPADEINAALTSKTKHFPRSHKSYRTQIGRLAKLGRQYPDAMVFALMALLPRAVGLAKQLTGYESDLSTVPWMQQLRGTLSFGALASRVKSKLPVGSDSLVDLLGHLVELAAADALHAFMSAENVILGDDAAVWATRLCAFMICKHPAYCAPLSWNSVNKYPLSDPESKVFTAVPNKNAVRVFQPAAVQFAHARTLVFEQFCALLGLLSRDRLAEVSEHVMGLAERTSHDPLSVVLLSGCRYLRWGTEDAAAVNLVRMFLRFVIAQLDGHRSMPERNAHIQTMECVVSRLDFTNVYAKQDVLSLFQVEVNQIYTMCVRWSKQEELKDSSYMLLATIFSRCPSSFLVKSHNFIAKRLIGPFSSSEKSRRSLEAHTQILRGCHARENFGWLPKFHRLGHWSCEYVHFDTDESSAFQFVPRADETRETRIGRVMQICEAMYFKSQLSGGLRLEPKLVTAMVGLLLQCTASAFEYMTTVVLPAMLGAGAMHRKENDAKEWKLAALAAVRVIFDQESGFRANLSKSLAKDQDEEHNHVTFEELFEEVSASFVPLVKELAQGKAKRIPPAPAAAAAESIFPHIQVVGGLDSDVLDDQHDLAPDLAAAAGSVPACREEVERRKEDLGRQIKEELGWQGKDGPSSSPKSPSESLRLANRLRLRAIWQRGQGGYLKANEGEYRSGRDSSRCRLLVEFASALTFLEPNHLCGLDGGEGSFLQSLLFSEDPIILRGGSLVLQRLAEAAPARIPDLLALVCAQSSTVALASPHRVLFCLAHAAHLAESWLHHLGAKSDLPAVLLSESHRPLHMAEAWALASLCHGDEGVRAYALWLLRLTGRIGEALEKLRSARQADPAGKPFSSCSRILVGDALVDRAFYRASTDYADLDSIQLPELRSDAGKIIQPTVCGLITTKHEGKCWPKVSRGSKVEGRGSGVELGKSELHLNLLLELADVICAHSRFQPTLHELWALLRKATRQLPEITASIREEEPGNTLVTLLCLFFGIAASAREEERSELGIQQQLNYGEKRRRRLDRPSRWTAMVEEDGEVRNLGTSPMEADHVSSALEKWAAYCSETDMKNAADTLRFGALADSEINFDEVRKWVENKRSRKYDRAAGLPLAEEVRNTIYSFMSDKAFFSNVLKPDGNLREIVYKCAKSAHWSSTILIVQCLVQWYEETSTPAKTAVLLELVAHLLTSHDIHLSMQYSDNMLDCVLTAISALEQDLETLVIPGAAQASDKVVTDEKIELILRHRGLIERYASLLCFLSSTFKKLYGGKDGLWPARRRKHSLAFLSRVSANIVEVLGRDPKDGEMEDKQSRIESLVDPVALALNEVVSVCTARDIEEEFKSPELALDGVGHHLSVTLRLLLESKKPDFRLDTHIRRCANSKQSAQQFNALYHYVLVSSSRPRGPVEFEDLDARCVATIVEHAPTLVVLCTREIFRDNRETFGNAAKLLIVIAAVVHVTYADNHDNLEFQATMAMLHGLHHSFATSRDAYSVDVVKRVAGTCTKLAVEVISEACLLLEACLEREEDVLWILKTLSYWCEPVDTIMLNACELRIDETALPEAGTLQAKRAASSVILSELCALTVAIYAKGGLSSSIHLAGMVEVWESLCYSHGEVNNGSMIEITTFLMQRSIDGVVSRPLLRRILDALCKTLQDQMVSVLTTLALRSLDVTLNEQSGYVDHHTLSISGLAAVSLSNVFQGMTALPRSVRYAKLFACAVLTLDSANDLQRAGMRSLLSSLMSQIRSARDREPLSDVILKLCNASSDSAHGKILEWSNLAADEYPNPSLRATVRACTVYLSGISGNFDIELGESALEMAFTSKNEVLAGRAFEILACLDCYAKMSMRDVCRVLPMMARVFREKGGHLLGLNREDSTLLQSQETLSSKSLYLCRQACRFLRGLVRTTNAGDSGQDKGDLVVYFWITVAILRCKIRPIYSNCLDILASLMSNKGDVYLSSYARNQPKFFWEFCEGWRPQMDGIGQVLLWGILQDNYQVLVKSLQLFTHSSALQAEEIFHRAQMQRGDVTGTKVFKTAIAILWLNLVLEENCTPKHAGVNAHLPFSDFAQLEFFKAKQVTTQGEVGRGEWRGLADVLVLGSKGNFDNEPHRFLTACARNLGESLGKRDLLQFCEVLTVLACRGSRHVRLPCLKMVLVLVSQPDKYFASELLETFFPIMDKDFAQDLESKDLAERIVGVLQQSNAFRMLRGEVAAPANFRFYEEVIEEEGSARVKSSLSAILIVSSKVEDYALAKEANTSGWDKLFSNEAVLTISEKLAEKASGRGPRHRKRKDDDDAIEAEFLTAFEKVLKTDSIQSTFLSKEPREPKKGMGDFLRDSKSPLAAQARSRGPIIVGSKVRRKKTKKASAAAPPPLPPLELLMASQPARAGNGEIDSEDSYSYSYSYSDDEGTEDSYSYSSEGEEDDVGAGGGYDSDDSYSSYDYSSSYSTSTSEPSYSD